MPAALLGLLPLLDGVLESVTQEVVGFSIVTRILLDDLVEFFTEVEFLHSWVGTAREWLANACWRQGRTAPTLVQQVKKSHAPKQRREANHVAWQRQLLVLATGLLLGLHVHGVEPAAAPSASPAPTAQEELHAATLLEAALFAREAREEEFHKLDGVFAGLEKKYPGDAAIKNAHAEFLWSIEEPQRAMETWLAAEKLDPDNATVLDHLGGSYLAAGNVKKATGYYQRAVGSAPGDAAAHFSYANVLFIFRHELLDGAHPDARAVLTKALEEFSEAARLQPNDANYARAFAETFYTIDSPDWQAALGAWEHFYTVTSQKDFALLNLARVHMKLGQKAEAREKLGLIHDPAYSHLKAQLNQRLDEK